MAKSLRAKTRQSAGRKRRATGHYAVAEAARVQRLSDKLLGKTSAKGKGKEMRKDEDGDEVIADEGGEGEGDEAVEEDAVMAEDEPKVSTSGKRGSRREQWRASKGMTVKKSKNARGAGTKSATASKPKRRR